jgi:hypothetical protein
VKIRLQPVKIHSHGNLLPVSSDKSCLFILFVEVITMYTTADERGILNNYATEPELFYASYPSPEQQHRYLFQGAIATLFVT